MILSFLMPSVLINSLKCGLMKYLRKLSEITVQNGILVTYSVQGKCKRMLRKHGFNVYRSSGSARETSDNKGSKNLKNNFSLLFFTEAKVLSLRKFKNLKLYQMKIKGLIVLTIVVAIMLGSCAKTSISNAKIKTKEDSLSYAFGIVNFNALQS